jgi:hypothetical protein
MITAVTVVIVFELPLKFGCQMKPHPCHFLWQFLPTPLADPSLVVVGEGSASGVWCPTLLPMPQGWG